MKATPSISPPKGPVRVVTYSRVSTDEQVQHGVSIEHQPVLIRRELDARFGAGNYLVVADLSDPGLSGYFGPTVFDQRFRGKRARPGLVEVFNLIEARMVDLIAVQDVSRLYRDESAMIGFIDVLLLPHDVDLFSATEVFDIHTPAGRLLCSVLAATAGFLRRSSNAKVKSTLDQRRREGLWQGSAPYGWRFASATEVEQGATKTLVPIPEQLIGVKRATELYLSGHSLIQVAAKLNAEGVVWTRNHANPETRKDERWTDTRVKLVLRCPAHAGLVRTAEGELIKAAHAPRAPITPEQFEAIARAMDERRTKFRGVRVAKPDFILSGIPRCECCGGKLMAKRMEGGGYAYMCPARRLVDEGEHPPIWARTLFLEQLVVSEIGRLAIDSEVLDEARLLVHQKSADGSDADRDELSRVNAQLASHADARARATEKLVNGVLDDAAYGAFVGNVREQEAELSARADQLRKSVEGSSNRATTLRKALDALQAFPLCWDHLEPCEKAELLRATIENLAVGTDVSGSYVCLKLRNFDAVTRRLPREAAGPMTRGSGPDSLTYAEWAVLYFFAIGKNCSEIASMTGRSKSTVSTVCGRILERLDQPDMKRAVKAAGKLAIEFAETFDLELLRKRRRQPENALTPMEKMAVDLEKKGYTPKEMAKLGISQERIDKLLVQAKAKVARQQGDLA